MLEISRAATLAKAVAQTGPAPNRIANTEVETHKVSLQTISLSPSRP